jgi:hypothetical protein
VYRKEPAEGIITLFSVGAFKVLASVHKKKYETIERLRKNYSAMYEKKPYVR